MILADEARRAPATSGIENRPAFVHVSIQSKPLAFAYGTHTLDTTNSDYLPAKETNVSQLSPFSRS